MKKTVADFTRCKTIYEAVQRKHRPRQEKVHWDRGFQKNKTLGTKLLLFVV